MRIGRTVILIVAWSGFVSTAAFGQSVVLSDGGIAFPDDTEQVTAVFTGTAPLAKSGQTSCFDASGNLTLCGTGVGAGQEGHVRPGVRWPIPRFTKNGDGTVTDNLTGLIWLEDANCVAADNFDAILALANTLYDGSTGHGGGDCGLSDGSVAGDWREPNMFEATSLLNHGYSSPGVPNTTGTGQWSEGDPFSEIQTSYWTSTFNPQNKQFAHYVSFFPPFLTTSDKDDHDRSMWPVRGPAENGGPSQAAIVLADGGVQFPDGSVQSTAASARVVIPKTGQVSCYAINGAPIACAGTGQDGDHQAGVAWPNPRFTINGDGTVTDNMTGLVWLEDANCDGTKNWETALSWANGLFDGSISSGGVNQDCGLSDGSLPGEWRVPTEAEFESLACMEYDNPAISNTEGTGQWASGDPFIDLQSGSTQYYWTSTSVETGPASAYLGFPRSLATATTGKSYAGYVWPVRDSR